MNRSHARSVETTTLFRVLYGNPLRLKWKVCTGRVRRARRV